MTAIPVRFGTDGWRAVLADDFTLANLRRVTLGTVEWLTSHAMGRPSVVVGCDARFMGTTFAQFVASTFVEEGINVVMARGITPTPAISWYAATHGMDAGIAITASHNPPEYNGYKVKTGDGAPAGTDITRRIELHANLGEVTGIPGSGQLKSVAVGASYLNHLKQCFNLEVIKQAGLHMVHDAMFGASRGCFRKILAGRHVAQIRSTENPGFDGLAPEPIGRNLGALSAAVVARTSSIGIANDGDGDRIGVVDETGEVMSPHTLMAVFVKYLHEEKGLTGLIIKSVSTSRMLDRMAAAYGLRCVTCPIGFKYIAPSVVKGEALVGGEESGGIAFKGHIPDRDGIYAGMLLLEMLAVRGKSLTALIDEVHQEFGPHAYRRIDLKTVKKASVLALLGSDGGLRRIAGEPVVKVDRTDGFKHITEKGWLLVRPSGTEPLLRLYAEGETGAMVNAMLQDVMDQLGLN